jgi:ribonuclease HI
MMMESLAQEEFVSMAVTLWAIWYTRRKIIFEDEYQSPLSTHVFVQNYLRDLAISLPRKLVSGRNKVAHPKWIPPSSGFMKINVDAAVSKTEKKGAVGVVCRDSKGAFVGASVVVVDGISDPGTLEAMACREAMALATDLNLQSFVVASDCAMVVNNLQENYGGSYSMITDEIKGWMKDFSTVVFKHENRASNSEAHRVARSFVSVSTGRQVWLLQPPAGLCIPVLINQ